MVHPDVNPQGKTLRLTITLPESLATAVVREAVEHETSVSGLVREAVAEYFARREPEGLPEFVGMIDDPDLDPTISERVEEIIAEDFGHGDPDRG